MGTFSSLIGIVIIYLVIIYVVEQVAPSVKFYIQFAFILVLATHTIQFLVPLLHMAVTAVPENLTDLTKALLFSLCAFIGIDWFETYLTTQHEHVIAKVIGTLFKLALLYYWIQFLF